MVRGVIFDVDGTLVDSVDLHAEAWQTAFLPFGYGIPVELGNCVASTQTYELLSHAGPRFPPFLR